MGPIVKANKTNVLPLYGTPVKIRCKILPKKECAGFLVNAKHIECRRASENGVYRGYVPGAGGDVWWIQHDDGTVGAYMFSELTDVRKK